MYICMYVYIYMYVCLFVCLSVCMCVCMYVCVYVCTCCMYVCIYVCMCICLFVCLQFVCIYVCLSRLHFFRSLPHASFPPASRVSSSASFSFPASSVASALSPTASAAALVVEGTNQSVCLCLSVSLPLSVCLDCLSARLAVSLSLSAQTSPPKIAPFRFSSSYFVVRNILPFLSTLIIPPFLPLPRPRPRPTSSSIFPLLDLLTDTRSYACKEYDEKPYGGGAFTPTYIKKYKNIHGYICKQLNKYILYIFWLHWDYI